MVDVRGKTLYRGGGAGNNPHGTYLTTDKDFASSYGSVSSHTIPKDAKILDMDKDENTKHWHPYHGTEHFDKKNLTGDKMGLFGIIGADKGDYEDDAAMYQSHRDRIMKAGYDGISLSHGMGKGHTRVFMFNKKKDMKEEMTAGSGQIAGIGIGTQGEPGIKRAQRGQFGKWDTFKVSPDRFHKIKEEKRKGKHWSKYLEKDDYYHDIREYANHPKNKNKPVILQDERTGAMTFARYGKERY